MVEDLTRVLSRGQNLVPGPPFREEFGLLVLLERTGVIEVRVCTTETNYFFGRE